MSITDPSGKYSPPPVPRKALSPWAWMGIGCGGLVLVGGIGCGALFLKIINTPFDKEAELRGLGDIPLYPGSKVDEALSKGAAVGKSIVPNASQKGTINAVSFRVPDDSAKVIAYYDQKMPTIGYKTAEVDTKVPSFNQIQQKMYTRGKEMAIIQTQVQKGSDMPNVLTLMHITPAGASQMSPVAPKAK